MSVFIFYHKASTRLFLLTASLIVAIGVTSCDNETAEQTGEEASDAKPALQAVRVQEVRIGPFTLNQRHLATVVPVTRTRLIAQVPGTVSSRGVAEGVLTTEGSPLISIAAPDLAARQRRVTAERRRVERERDFVCSQLKTDQKLATSGDLPTLQVAQTEKGCNMATQAVNAARAAEQEVAAQQKKSTEDAPFDGVVLSYLVDIGQTVMPGTPLADFASKQRQLQLRVVSEDLQKITLEGDVLLPHDEHGTIKEIGQSASGPGRLYEVLIDVPEDAPYRVGETILARVVVDTLPHASAVPDAALRTDQNGSYVLLEKDGHLTRKDVKATLSADGWTAVEPMLEEGARVVTVAPANIDETSLVFAVAP